MTSERMPALASRCGNGNRDRAMSGSYTSCPRTQRARPFSSMGTTVFSLMSERRRAIGSLRAPTQLTVSRFSPDVVQADAAEIHRQFFLDAAHHHLEDAAQVLALADGARDARHQRQALQLLAEPRFVLQPLGDVAVVGDDGAHRRVVEQVGGDALEPDPAAVLVAAAPDQRDRLARVREQLLDGMRRGPADRRDACGRCRAGLTTLRAGSPRRWRPPG